MGEVRRERDCTTLEQWRDRARHLEAEWGRCSHHCAVIQTERDAALAKVAELTAACAAKDGVIIRFLNAPLAQRDGTPVPSLLLASARAALSDTAGANMIDATGR